MLDSPAGMHITQGEQLKNRSAWNCHMYGSIVGIIGISAICTDIKHVGSSGTVCGCSSSGIVSIVDSLKAAKPSEFARK